MRKASSRAVKTILSEFVYVDSKNVFAMSSRAVS